MIKRMLFRLTCFLGRPILTGGHVSDAVSVYNQLISSHPDDFRGYLAKVRSFFSLPFLTFLDISESDLKNIKIRVCLGLNV